MPNSRLECTNHTIFQTKTVEIDTLFQTKTANIAYIYTYIADIAYKGAPPLPFGRKNAL